MANTDPSRLTLIEPTNPLLNTVALEVDPAEIGSQYIQGIIDRMLELAAGKGHSEQDSRQMVGLAAPQLGISKRIITIDLTADGSNKEQHLQVIINPKITYRSKTTLPGREGCWSCGNICGNVERAKNVTLAGYARYGQPIKLKLTGFVARIAQHEVDHLEGIRFPDRIPLSEPSRLHWVEHADFEKYRQHWEHWPAHCPRVVWETLKAGRIITP